MAQITDIHRSPWPRLLRLLTAPFRAFLDALVMAAELNPRLHEIRKLQAMSDAELAQRGLTRDGIVQHVFRDRFYT